MCKQEQTCNIIVHAVTICTFLSYLLTSGKLKETLKEKIINHWRKMLRMCWQLSSSLHIQTHSLPQRYDLFICLHKWMIITEVVWSKVWKYWIPIQCLIHTKHNRNSQVLLHNLQITSIALLLTFLYCFHTGNILLNPVL